MIDIWIRRITHNLFQVDIAVELVTAGPCKNSGYRAVCKRVRTELGIPVPRQRVYDSLKEQDPEG